MQENKMTIFTVVYNNYGRFIDQWVGYLKKQTIPVDMIVVLGEDHGFDISRIKEFPEVMFIEHNSDNMGILRNQAMPFIKTDWWMYFSVDDELLPTACECIVNSKEEAVSLLFDVVECNGELKTNTLSPCINSFYDLGMWGRAWGGYTAVKGNHDLRFRVDLEVPNLTLHFDLFKRGVKTVRSTKSLAIHHRWPESHHFRHTKLSSGRVFVKEINKVKDEVIEDMLKDYKKVKIRALQSYTDLEVYKKPDKYDIFRDGKIIKVVGGRIKSGDEYIVDKDRGIYLSNVLNSTKRGGKPEYISVIVDVVKH